MDGEEGSEKRSLSDAARDVIRGFRDTRPDFLSNKDKKNSKRRNGSDGVAGGLRSAEQSAANDGIGASASGLGGVRDKETKVGGLYSGSGKAGGGVNSVKGKAPVGKGALGKNKAKGIFKKAGPLVGAAVTIMIFGISAFGGFSTQIIAWKENISSVFGQSSAVINKRSSFLMRTLLKTNRDTTSTSIFGNTKFKISSKLSKKLAEQGINYVETDDTNGKKIKMLIYEDADGKFIPIVASESDVGRANALKGTEIDVDGKKIRINGDSMTLNEARNRNKNFNIDYDTATITFSGKIAGWFDDVADNMYKRIVGDRARNQTDISDPDEEKVDEMLLGNKSDGVENSELSATKEETDENGKVKERPAETDDAVADGKTYGDIESESGKIKTGDVDVPSVESGLKAKAQKVAMMSTTVGCAVLRGIGAISAAIGAVQTMNVINYASKYLEIADKIKAGDADEVTNIALNNINEPVKTTAYDIDGNIVELDGSTTSSAGFNAPFSSKNIINENDPSALYANREYANKNAIRNAMGAGALSDVIGAVSSFGAGITAFRICNGLQAVAGIADAVGDVVSVFTLGIGKAVKDIIKGAVEGAVFAAAMLTITSIISAITPMVASWFAGQLFNAFLGTNGGYSLLSGSQSILNTNLQMSTGRFADRENAIELAALTREVENQWAAYERATKSPFDTTSKYTFMGSIVNAMIPIANTASGTLTSVITPVAELAGSSALALVNPSANAASDVSEFAASLASSDNCPYLTSVDVAGDFACNKYAGAYVNEINTVDPDTIYQNMESYGSFEGEDSDGNPKIKMDSDYAKYIVACVSSDSQPGTMNAAVEGFIQKATDTGNTVANGLINFGMNFVPFEGFIDAIDAGEQENNMKWNSGWACTGKTDDDAFNEKVKNFSMYNLDQRVLSDMGIIDSNSTISFLEEYYKENPLDNSFEGQIARFSGMTKEEVSDTLALIEYYKYIAEYKPAERYAFGEPAVKVEKELKFDNENTVADNLLVVLFDPISYADVRNRSFAA